MATIIKNPHTVHGAVPLEPDPTTLYTYKVECKSWGGGGGGGGLLGTKSHKKGQKILGLASTSRQDVIYPSLSVSRGRPAMGSTCFVQTGLETTRTSPKALPDKP